MTDKGLELKDYVFFVALDDSTSLRKGGRRREGLVPMRVHVRRGTQSYFTTVYIDPSKDKENVKKAHKLGLPVPPSAVNVWISPDKKFAKYQDSKGRWKQARNADLVKNNEDKKWAKLKEFVQHYPRIMQRVERDMAHSEEANVLYLMGVTGMRVGGERDTKAETKAYGAHTLTSNHVKLSSGSLVTLSFPSKKGVKVELELDNPKLYTMFKARVKKGSDAKVFNTSYNKIRDYMEKVAPGFTPHDFRRYRATAYARELVKELSRGVGTPVGAKTRKRIVKETCTRVAALLANTPAMAKKAYIHPEVWDSF